MNLKRLFSLLTLTVLVVSTLAAHTPSSQDSTKDSTKADKAKTDQEKAQEALEKKALTLLDEVLKEATSLRLAENRIRLQASAADLLWSRNEKRARALFKQVIDSFSELLAGEEGAATSPAGFTIEGFAAYPVVGHPGLVQARVQLRQEILQLLTSHDARLARDFLRATSAPDNRESQGYVGPNADTEMDLNLAAQMAADDPKQALQIAEEYLEKGFPYGLANVLNQLQNKDPEAAAKLAAEIMKRLRFENLGTNREAATLALMLLGQEGAAEETYSSSNEVRTASRNQSVLDEKAIRELLNMLMTAALSQRARKPGDSEGEDRSGQPPLAVSLGSLMPKIERYAPSRVPALRKKIAEYESTLPSQTRAYKEFETVLQTGNAQALMDAASKANPEMKEVLVMQAIMRAAGEGDFDRARLMINENIKDAGQRKNLLANINRQVLQHSSMQGKLDEARPLLSQIPPEERAGMLTQFAVAAIGKGDKKLGLQILDEARGLLGAQAANYVELNALLQLAQSYAPVEPGRSFDIIEPTVEQLNVLLSALVSLDGFESWQQFKEGELIGSGQSIIVNMTLQCARDLALLSRADFDRAKADADRFNRSDMRLTARLFVAQGVLSDQ